MIHKTKRVSASQVVAEDEILDEVVDEVAEDAQVEVDPEATELLFEAEDVAELVAEITGQDVEVSVNDNDTVDFTIGEDVYTVSAEGDEEILEASTRVLKKKDVKASTQKVQPQKAAAGRRAVRRVR